MVHRDLLGLHPTGIALVGASIHLGVAVQNFFPQAATRDADAIIVARHGGEIENHQHNVGVRARFADETQGAVFGVVMIGPLEAVGMKIQFVQRWLGLIKVVEIRDAFLHAAVEAILERVPLDVQK